MELGTGPCLIIIREVDFTNQLMLTMCKRAIVLKFAEAKEFPVAAHFRLQFDLVISYESVPFLCVIELLLGSLDGCSYFEFNWLCRHMGSFAGATVRELSWDIRIVSLIWVFSGRLLIRPLLLLRDSEPALTSHEWGHIRLLKVARVEHIGSISLHIRCISLALIVCSRHWLCKLILWCIWFLYHVRSREEAASWLWCHDLRNHVLWVLVVIDGERLGILLVLWCDFHFCLWFSFLKLFLI